MADFKNSNPGGTPHGRGGPQGFKLVGFPKEFEKHFWDVFDKRYYGILLITWVLLYSFAFFMSTRQWQMSEQEKQQIKQNYLQQLYTEIVTPPATTEAEGPGAGLLPGEEEGAGKTEELSEEGQQLVSESVADKVKRRQAGAGERLAKRRKMEQEAAGYGVLGALTAGGEGGSGSLSYADILGGSDGAGSGIGDAGSLVAGTAALQAATQRGQKTRLAKGGGFGGEVGETGIDDLISGTGVSGGSSVSRSGSIKLAQGTRVSGSGAGATQRDPEVIDATINQNKASVEYCYQSQLKVDPNLRGEILLTFDILPSGRVGAVKIINSTLNNPKVERCIISSVRRWSNFPALTGARGVVTIKTKFVFG